MIDDRAEVKIRGEKRTRSTRSLEVVSRNMIHRNAETTISWQTDECRGRCSCEVATCETSFAAVPRICLLLNPVAARDMPDGIFNLALLPSAFIIRGLFYFIFFSLIFSRKFNFFSR